MEKMRELTFNVRQNQQELGDFLKDLDSWTGDIKKQDQNLKTMKPREQAISSMPPVRTKLITEKIKNKRNSEKEKVTKERIKSADYRKWEKLDIDQMCKEIDEEEEDEDKEVQVEIEKLDLQRKEKVAAEMKEKGNEHFKNKGYTAAIECYTTGMQADPSNPVFPANRAMAYLRLKKYSEAETDCTLTLSLDPSYVKAYLRRGTARVALGKTTSAQRDFKDALKLEPGNSQAKAELKKIEIMEKGGKATNLTSNKEESPNSEKSARVHPVFIPPKDRSKKPLMRVEVEEIGYEEKVTMSDTNLAKGIVEIGEKPSTVKLISESSTSMDVENEKLMEYNSISKKGDACSATKEKPKSTKPPFMSNDNSVPAVTKRKIPGRPTTSFQFQAHVRALSGNLNDLFRYLLQITPDSIPSLLKQQLETETLVAVLKCLKESTDWNLVFSYLKQFSRTRRFDMAVMFFSDEEKAEVQSLFAMLTSSLPEQSSEFDGLSKKYGL